MVNSGAGRPLKKRPSFIYCSRRYLCYTVLGLMDFLSYWLVFSLRKLSFPHKMNYFDLFLLLLNCLDSFCFVLLCFWFVLIFFDFLIFDFFLIFFDLICFNLLWLVLNFFDLFWFVLICFILICFDLFWFVLIHFDLFWFVLIHFYSYVLVWTMNSQGLS